MARLVAELKRRNVFRVAAAYAVVAWVVIQIAETIFPPIGVPEWVLTMVIALAGLGFPISLVVSWFYEWTPDGVMTTEAADAAGYVQPGFFGRQIDFVIIALLVIAVGWLIYERDVPVEAPEASIAVLPFADLSPEGDQEYFSDGISEELLNVLAKIPELRVAARTSSFQFKGENRDISEIARLLNVAHVLEGSVRKSGDRIRITAQLIEAQSGFHLWSESYDRRLDDIFAVQDEISAAIVAALSETLGIDTALAAPVKVAANTEAYNSHLQGQYLLRRRTNAAIKAAIPNFENAIELDPDFAPAYAGLGLSWMLLNRGDFGDLEWKDALALAQPNIDRALALDPDLAIALGVRGLSLPGTNESLEAYERALKLNPSLSQVRAWYSAALRRDGRAAESFEQIRLAYESDPLSIMLLYNYVSQLLNRRLFDQAAAPLDRLTQLDPLAGLTLRGNIQWDRNRPAEAIVEYFRGLGHRPDTQRLRRRISVSLLAMGLDAEFKRFYPFAGVEWQYLNNIEYSDALLQMSRARVAEAPDRPGRVTGLAINELYAGNEARAVELARRALALLEEADRPPSLAWFVLAAEAYNHGDMDQVREYLAWQIANTRSQFANGVDNSTLHYVDAVTQFMTGNREAAVSAMARTYSMGAVDRGLLGYGFEVLGWKDIPEMAALRDENDALVARERQKLLVMSCVDKSIAGWIPLSETCALLDKD